MLHEVLDVAAVTDDVQGFLVLDSHPSVYGELLQREAATAR